MLVMKEFTVTVLPNCLITENSSRVGTETSISMQSPRSSKKFAKASLFSSKKIYPVKLRLSETSVFTNKLDVPEEEQEEEDIVNSKEPFNV